jgi:hypothetical protein
MERAQSGQATLVIAAAQKVEHYEIASQRTIRTLPNSWASGLAQTPCSSCAVWRQPALRLVFLRDRWAAIEACVMGTPQLT